MGINLSHVLGNTETVMSERKEEILAKAHALVELIASHQALPVQSMLVLPSIRYRSTADFIHDPVPKSEMQHARIQ
jgi:hypothetical protein